MFDGMFLIILVLVLYYVWRSALGAREQARELGTALCARANVQLLDQTVALQRLGLMRGSDGRLRIRRRYRFELSTDGLDRQQGSLDIAEDRLISYSLPVHAQDAAPAYSSPVSGSNVIAFGKSHSDATRH